MVPGALEELRLKGESLRRSLRAEAAVRTREDGASANLTEMTGCAPPHSANSYYCCAPLSGSLLNVVPVARELAHDCSLGHTALRRGS